MAEQMPTSNLTRSAVNVIYRDLDKQMDFQRDMELQKLKNAPKIKGVTNETLDNLEGHTNEVKKMLADAEKLESLINTLPQEELMSERGQALVQQYSELTSPSRLNSLKRSYEYSKQAMKDNERHEARDEYVSIDGEVYVEDGNAPRPNVKRIPRGEFISSKGRYKPLTSAELILYRDQLPELANDTKVTAAISQIEGMSRVTAAIQESIKGIGKSDLDADFAKEIKTVLGSKGNVSSNTRQAEKALSFIRSSLTSGMLETLRNQAMMNVDDPRLVDNWVSNLLAEKIASYYDIESPGEAKGRSDKGVFANIDAGSAALDWRTLNLVSASDKTQKQEVYQTTVPPTEMDVLEKIALVKYPGESQPTNRPLSEINTPILLADGTQIYSENIENAESIYLTEPTGKVLRVPDPIYKPKYEQYLKDANQLAKRLEGASEDEQAIIRQQMEAKQRLLNAVPTRSYFEYKAVMEASVASQSLFSQVIDGKEEKVVEGVVKKSVAENNAYGMKEHKGEFYDDKFGGIFNYPIELPVYIRIDNLSYMDDKSDKYTQMLIKEKETQDRANEMNIRMTSRGL